ncbi:tyrosine-type recombinase/integrase [Chryseobacterium limigenitum]|uniref:Site-specific recombinase XerD n=1 Tax=Chryseobacterium limigenitum TaxID=1612149 RepID=A0A1K2IMA2_9FLAO|nr:site-specific integrase [Chryseobacterium limigenitum]SFZ93495.1 Site-specific recombinase XerD [Chryseobacterium limigenitum]
MEYKISIVHDARRATADGSFPAKLRVYSTLRKSAKLYNINKYYTKEDFENITDKRPAKRYQEEAIALKSIEAKAEQIAKNLEPFNFPDFESQFYGNLIDKSNIFDYYKEAIEGMKGEDRIKTASSYNSSLKSLKRFLNPANPDAVNKLHIIDINKAWLNKYEKYMLDNGKSYTTIGIYLRPLKAMYNIAMSENPAYEKHYPFGKGQYEIPATVKVKKALKKDNLKILFKAVPKNKLQEKAKDFWFLSYICNGMNMNDIARLKFKDISFEENKLTFYRGKTQRTKKTNLKEISVLLTSFSKVVISKYQKKETSPEDFVFNIISKEDTATEKVRKIENFTRFVNDHIKNLAKANEITAEISTYWARHSFSTMALNSGANIELIGEYLGHSDIKTTKNYLSGFDDANKEAIINKITDFL